MPFKRLTFASQLCDNQNKSNPEFYLKEVVYISRESGYAVESFYGTNSFYTIDSRNNMFAFVETDTPTVNRYASIPHGNYTLNTFLTALQTALDEAGTYDFTITNNPLINKLTISATGNFKIIDSMNNCYYETGFIVSSGFASSVVAPNPFDLSGVKVLHIVSSSFGTDSSSVCNKNLNVIASIPIAVPYLGVVSYFPPLCVIQCSLVELNSVDFAVFDERFRRLDMNQDWAINILFEN